MSAQSNQIFRAVCIGFLIGSVAGIAARIFLKPAPPVTHVETAIIKTIPVPMHTEAGDLIPEVNSWLNGSVFGMSFALADLPPRWVCESVTNATKNIYYDDALDWDWKPFTNYTIKTNFSRAELIVSVPVDTNICGRVFRIRALK